MTGNIVSRADQMATHQMYGQTGNSSEPQIDQNMHNRNYYSTRYFYYFLFIRFYYIFRYRYICNESICIWRQAISQQQQQQASVSAGKELTPAHQASLPQGPISSPRTNPVYQSTGYTSVAPQVSIISLMCMKN